MTPTAPAHRMTARRRSGLSGERAFTLVELLVVVAVVTLLLALLLPAMRNAKAYALDAVCSSNVRTIAQAEYTYAYDYRRFLTEAATGEPRPDGQECLVDVHPWEKTRGILWYETLLWGKYIDTLEIFVDPVDTNPPRDENFAFVSYAINAYLERGGNDNQISSIHSPARTLMITANNPAKPTHSGVWNYARPDAHRHVGYRAMYAFCDGHVEAKSFRDMFEVEYDPQQSYADHWTTARPSMAAVWMNGWANDRTGEEFAYWVPWWRDGEFNQWGNK